MAIMSHNEIAEFILDGDALGVGSADLCWDGFGNATIQAEILFWDRSVFKEIASRLHLEVKSPEWPETLLFAPAKGRGEVSGRRRSLDVTWTCAAAAWLTRDVLEWNDRTVVRLADRIASMPAAEYPWVTLPILADALEEAGLTTEYAGAELALKDLRGGGHGMWVVRLILAAARGNGSVL